jgi:hypothetical protein
VGRLSVQSQRVELRYFNWVLHQFLTLSVLWTMSALSALAQSV